MPRISWIYIKCIFRLFLPYRIILYFYRHSHNICDQFFSRVSARLSQMDCLTLEKFIEEVKNSYTPSPNMILLKRTLNVKEWLDEHLAKFQDGMSLARQFVYSKNHDGSGSTEGGVTASVRCSEWSSSEMGEPQFPLQSLPSRVPQWNTNRQVFSKWETRTTRTDPKIADNHLCSAITQIEDLDLMDFQHASWRAVFKRIRKWEKFTAFDYDGPWPLTADDVTKWVSTFDIKSTTKQVRPNLDYA